MEPSVFTLPTILAIIAIVIGIFAIVLAVHLYGKLRSMLDKDELREFIVRSVRKDDRIRLEVKQIAKTVVPAPVKEEMSTENFNAIVETVMVGIESKLAKMKEIELASAPRSGVQDSENSYVYQSGSRKEEACLQVCISIRCFEDDFLQG